MTNATIKKAADTALFTALRIAPASMVSTVVSVADHMKIPLPDLVRVSDREHIGVDPPTVPEAIDIATSSTLKKALHILKDTERLLTCSSDVTNTAPLEYKHAQ
jgi:hypothetical protein